MMGNLVLVIDDSITISKIIAVGLHREGYKVMCCHKGETALRWLASREAHVPDLILVDLCLPAMDGYSVIQYLRTQTVFKSTPIVIISRRDGMLDKLKARLVGANGYLVKPFTMEALVSVIHNHLHGSLVGAIS